MEAECSGDDLPRRRRPGVYQDYHRNSRNRSTPAGEVVLGLAIAPDGRPYHAFTQKQVADLLDGGEGSTGIVPQVQHQTARRSDPAKDLPELIARVVDELPDPHVGESLDGVDEEDPSPARVSIEPLHGLQRELLACQ